MKPLQYNQSDFSITSDLLQSFVRALTSTEISLTQRIQDLFLIVLSPLAFIFELVINAYDLSIGNHIIWHRNREIKTRQDEWAIVEGLLEEFTTLPDLKGPEKPSHPKLLPEGI